MGRPTVCESVTGRDCSVDCLIARALYSFHLGIALVDPSVRCCPADLKLASLGASIGEARRLFTIEINDGKAAAAVKAMQKDVIVEVSGKLRHDRGKDKATKCSSPSIRARGLFARAWPHRRRRPKQPKARLNRPSDLTGPVVGKRTGLRAMDGADSHPIS